MDPTILKFSGFNFPVSSWRISALMISTLEKPLRFSSRVGIRSRSSSTPPARQRSFGKKGTRQRRLARRITVDARIVVSVGILLGLLIAGTAFLFADYRGRTKRHTRRIRAELLALP